MDSFSLAGKVAIVTGANSGIGQAIAIAFAQAGADIALAGRTPAQDTAVSIRAAGRRAETILADLSSLTAVDRIVDETFARFGGIDILVNNAGLVHRARALDVTEADWDAVLNVNLKAPFFLAQRVARTMLASGIQGSIINIASLVSFQGGIEVASYTAAKSALAGITRLLANEWAVHGINVNAIAPGYIVTGNTEALLQDDERRAEISVRIPAGRWGEPQDMCGAAVFLASDAASYVHGHVLAVDGGWLAR